MEELYKGTNARKAKILKDDYCTCSYKRPHTYGGSDKQLCVNCNKWIKPTGKAEAEKEVVDADIEKCLENLIFTASKLWDEVKNIKDTDIMTVTHPIIEEAKFALKAHRDGKIKHT